MFLKFRRVNDWSDDYDVDMSVYAWRQWIGESEDNKTAVRVLELRPGAASELRVTDMFNAPAVFMIVGIPEREFLAREGYLALYFKIHEFFTRRLDSGYRAFVGDLHGTGISTELGV